MPCFDSAAFAVHVQYIYMIEVHMSLFTKPTIVKDKTGNYFLYLLIFQLNT